MALSTIQITQGSGTAMQVDTSNQGAMQVVKLAVSNLGDTTLIPATAANGMLVDVSRVQGTVAVTGTFWQATQPVSGSVSITGTPNVAVTNTPNIGTVATITNPVTVTGTVNIGTSVSVTGTIGASQGAAAATGGAWPITITDAVNAITLQSVSGTYAVPVKVLAGVGVAVSQADKSAFTEGSTACNPIGAVYNDAFAGDPSAGQASVLRMTQKHALHVNFRKSDGTEIGTSSNPVAVVGASSGNLPVSQGTPAASTAPWLVQNQPSGLATGQAAWKDHAAFTASLSDQTIHAPSTGKTLYIEGIIITVSGSGLLKVYDHVTGAPIYWGTPPVGAVIPITPSRPIPTSAVNNILRYATGSGAAGDISAWGYEA